MNIVKRLSIVVMVLIFLAGVAGADPSGGTGGGTGLPVPCSCK